MATKAYDIIIVGTGFAASFYLYGLLKKAKPNLKVLVIERGSDISHAEQIKRRKEMPLSFSDQFVNLTPLKPWLFSSMFGGGSNCWWGCTPRMLPNDFKTKTLYGVGEDWPVSYDELEPFYSEAEEIMQISGMESSLFPRSRPFPQPPHRFSLPDEILHKQYGDYFIAQPTARARVPTASRPACCGSGVCGLCPIDAKFTVLNELKKIYQDPRVELRLNATVQDISIQGASATGVNFLSRSGRESAKGELVVLGANALFNPFLLIKSGLSHPALGAYLNEQVSMMITFDLNGVRSFSGSTSITGHGYMRYDGDWRKSRAGYLIESYNIPKIRLDHGRWTERHQIKCIFETIPQSSNKVLLDANDAARPRIQYGGPTSYTVDAMENSMNEIIAALKPLPIEGIVSKELLKTEGHIQGTTRMGLDPQQSIVDTSLVHHKIRNLVVLGSSVFPTCPPANPTLTIAALALRAAA